MAVVNKLSTVITNRDAVPRVHNNDYIMGGGIRHSVAALAVATGDTSLSTYRFGQINSGARMSSLSVFSDKLGTATAMSFGLYDTTANGSAAVSAALFASGYDLHTAAVNGSNVIFSNQSCSNAEKRVWEMLGLASDPNKDYDVVGTLTVTCDAGGQMAVSIVYST